MLPIVPVAAKMANASPWRTKYQIGWNSCKYGKWQNMEKMSVLRKVREREVGPCRTVSNIIEDKGLILRPDQKAEMVSRNTVILCCLGAKNKQKAGVGLLQKVTLEAILK